MSPSEALRIAIVGPTHPYKGGVTAHTTELAHALEAAGHDVQLVSWSNMFPKNFRSLVIDGVLSPTAWSGTRSTQSSPLEERLRSGRGASKALDKILRECGKVGPSRCGYAEGGDPKAKFAALTAELKKKPVAAKKAAVSKKVAAKKPAAKPKAAKPADPAD